MVFRLCFYGMLIRVVQKKSTSCHPLWYPLIFFLLPLVIYPQNFSLLAQLEVVPQWLWNIQCDLHHENRESSPKCHISNNIGPIYLQMGSKWPEYPYYYSTSIVTICPVPIFQKLFKKNWLFGYSINTLKISRLFWTILHNSWQYDDTPVTVSSYRNL